MEHWRCPCTAAAQVLSFITVTEHPLSLLSSIHNDVVVFWQPMLVTSLLCDCLAQHLTTEKDPVLQIVVVFSVGPLCCVCSDFKSLLRSLRLNSRANSQICCSPSLISQGLICTAWKDSIAHCHGTWMSYHAARSIAELRSCFDDFARQTIAWARVTPWPIC